MNHDMYTPPCKVYIKRTYELLLVYLGQRASGKEILSKKTSN